MILLLPKKEKANLKISTTKIIMNVKQFILKLEVMEGWKCLLASQGSRVPGIKRDKIKDLVSN